MDFLAEINIGLGIGVVGRAGLKPVALVKANGGVHARRGIKVEPLIAGFCCELFNRAEQIFCYAVPSMGGLHIHTLDFAAALNFRKFAEGNASNYIIFL